MAKFQNVIDDYQIIVLSAKHFNAIVYEGPQREKQIYLYHHENHFDFCISLSWQKLLVFGMQERVRFKSQSSLLQGMQMLLHR